MARPRSAYNSTIAPPLPRIGNLYAADQKASFRQGFMRLGMAEPIAVPMNMFAEPPNYVVGINKREGYLERRMPHVQTKSRTPIK